MKLSLFLHCFFFSLFAYAEDTYGPSPVAEPSLKELAPTNAHIEQRQIDLEQQHWYQRLEQNMTREEEMEWNIRPHHEITNKIKDDALKGGFRIDEQIRNLKPTQVEGELIIRY